MRFGRFATKLVEIERVRSRLEMTQLLADLLAELSQDEIREAVYLMSGYLLPAYQGVEFSMAEKMVLRGLALATEMKLELVASEYKKVGDLGVLASYLLEDKESKLSISEVYGKLLDLAKDSGEGSQERKVELLAGLLSDNGGDSGRILTKIVVGKLRLGFSEKTILDALSVVGAGDKNMRKKLDVVYQLTPDVGLIAEQVKKKGIERVVSNPQIEPGVPVINALCQRLESSEEMIEKMGVVAVERKYDGTRVQIHLLKSGKVRSFTRNLEESSAQFPELERFAGFVNAYELVLDAEAVGYDRKTNKILPFQMTITRKRKHGVEEAAESVPLRFFVFDCMYVDGETLVNKPYEDRRKILEEVVKKNDVFVVDEYVRTSEASVIHLEHEKYLDEGFEGAVIKKWDGEYLPGRQGWNWVKIKESEGTAGKLSDTLDLVIMGYYRGKGKRAEFGMGAMLVGTKKVGDDSGKIVTVAKIGTGISDELFVELKKKLDKLATKQMPENYLIDKSLVPDVFVDPELIVEIAADEITTSPNHSAGVALRFPRLVKVREDKNLDGVTTLAEIKQIGGY